MIDAKKAKLINEMNSTAFEVGLGDELKATADVANGLNLRATKTVTKALVAGDITEGVATVDTGIDFDTWYSVMVTTALGVPVVITKIARGTGENITKILITATGVAATDIVSVIVK